MIRDWFNIFNLTEFEATGLVSRTYTWVFPGVGQQDVLVTKGNLVGITYDGVYLAVNLNDRNPYARDGYAVFIDDNTNDVWLGIDQPEEES
jgi:hypothetical protein